VGSTPAQASDRLVAASLNTASRACTSDPPRITRPGPGLSNDPGPEACPVHRAGAARAVAHLLLGLGGSSGPRWSPGLLGGQGQYGSDRGGLMQPAANVSAVQDDIEGGGPDAGGTVQRSGVHARHVHLVSLEAAAWAASTCADDALRTDGPTARAGQECQLPSRPAPDRRVDGLATDLLGPQARRGSSVSRLPSGRRERQGLGEAPQWWPGRGLSVWRGRCGARGVVRRHRSAGGRRLRVGAGGCVPGRRCGRG
jgi:hypothetical protein